MSYKRIVLIALATVTFVVGGISLAVLLNGDHWKATALEKVNNELLTELSVARDRNFDLERISKSNRRFTRCNFTRISQSYW